MIFAHTIDKVLCGHKSQTRRLVKPNENLIVQNGIYRVVTDTRTVYQVGKTYAVQPGRGKKSVARILITNIRRERVDFINHLDALAEGFTSREEFLATWKVIHGSKCSLSCEVWVLEFEILIDEFRGEYQDVNNESSDNSYDIPAPIKRVSGIDMHSWNNGTWRVGTSVSNRLSLPS
mgnify:CR=1 FL=1